MRLRSLIETCVRDTRHGVRLLVHQPDFSTVAVLTLALGIGLSTSLLSVVHSSLIRPLPYPDAERLVRILIEEDNGKRRSTAAPSLNDVRVWNAANAEVNHVAIRQTVFPNPIFDAGVPERVESIRVSEEYFRLLGVTPRLGRLFDAADVTADAPGVVLISHAFWRSRFGDDSAIVGRLVGIDGVPTTVVGVLPTGFADTTPLWRPLQVPGSRAHRRSAGWEVYGRLADPKQISLATDRLTALLPSANATSNRSRVRITLALDDIRSIYTPTVTILIGSVGFILLLASVNVAGLLLARGTSRQTEIAVRASMGASRGRLIRQMLTESLCLSAVGGVAGIFLAWFTLDTVVANLGIRLPDGVPARLNLSVLLGSVAVTTFTGLLFGLIPALRVSRVHLGSALARSGRQHTTSLSRRAGQVLITVEVALAVVTVAGAGLMLRSLAHLVTVDLGFDPGSIFVVSAQPTEPREAVYAAYYPTLVDEIRRLPGVAEVGAGDTAPLGGNGLLRFAEVARAAGPLETTRARTVLPGYIEALGLPLLAGRLFTEADRHAGIAVVVINRDAAKQWFSDASPIGQALEINKVHTEVVGVVGSIRTHGPKGPIGAEVYLPLQTGTVSNPNVPPLPMLVLVRPQENSAGLPEKLRHLAMTVGAPAVVDGVDRGDTLMRETVDRERQQTFLLTLLGALGMVIATVGVFGMTSYSVRRRTQEIGVRLALGARPRRVVLTMLRESAMPILLGLILGTAAALFATRVIKSFLFEISPSDPLTLGLVALTLGAVGCVAAWIPARRAANIDPVKALRAE
jgi:putative ABC transport system permease protein